MAKNNFVSGALFGLPGVALNTMRRNQQKQEKLMKAEQNRQMAEQKEAEKDALNERKTLINTQRNQMGVTTGKSYSLNRTTGANKLVDVLG
jgi:hypothetical protein